MQASSHRGLIVRGIIIAALTACLSVGLTATAAASDRQCGRGVPASQVSVQLWTFAEYIGFDDNAASQARLEEVLRRLSEMGYRNVEPFSLNGLTAEEYRDLLQEYGLKAPSRHVGVGTPAEPADIDAIIEENRTLGVKYFGAGGTPNFATEAEWIAYARYLNELGAEARRAGQTLMVHNHNWEFERRFGDRTAFDILMQYTDRQNVAFQLDLYWAVFAGADPVSLLRRYGDRIQLLHVKDMRESDRRIEIVGRGEIDFPEIFSAAKNVRYYVVEHDPRFGDATFNPFEAAEAGFDYLDDVRFGNQGRHCDDDDGHPGRGHGHGHGRNDHPGRGHGHGRNDHPGQGRGRDHDDHPGRGRGRDDD